MRKIILVLILTGFTITQYGQIIADHSVVNKFDDIPQYYLNEVKKMWLSYPGESHAYGIRSGLKALAQSYPKYVAVAKESGTPEAYTTSHLRVSGATWGDYSHTTGWIYTCGEEDWWSNPTAITRIKAGISYCYTSGLLIGAMGFGWCSEEIYENLPTSGTDPVYGVRWYGFMENGPNGNRQWGLDAGDYSITGNSASMDTYLNVTQEFIDYCTINGYPTKVFFTTGPVDYNTGWGGEKGYQGHLKYEHIRDYVKADATRILFDYADILCYDNDGTPAITAWNGHTYPIITTTNGTPAGDGHISNEGALRLAKAMWWMLARMAGWDGDTSTEINDLVKDELSPTITNITHDEISIKLDDSNLFTAADLFNFQGQLVSHKLVDSNILVFDISAFPSGIYIVIISTGQHKQTVKFIKP